jgi:hypothetical protein
MAKKKTILIDMETGGLKAGDLSVFMSAKQAPFEYPKFDMGSPKDSLETVDEMDCIISLIKTRNGGPVTISMAINKYKG